MATISENLEALKSVKEDIKSAIEGKGQDLTNVPFTQYAEKVASIQAGEDLDAELNEQEELLNELESLVNTLPDKNVDLSQTTATAEDVLVGKKIYNVDGELVEGTYKDMLQQRVDNLGTCYQLFYQGADTNIDYLSKLDTSNVTDMSYMFYECRNLTSLDLSNFDTSNVTDMRYMFCICENLISLDVSSFNTSNVTNMEAVLSSLKKLSSIDLSNWDTRNVTNMKSMFYYDYELETIIGKLDVGNCTSLSSMFERCRELKNVTLKNIKVNLTMGSGTSYGRYLTKETLTNTIQELWDNTDNALGGSRTLTLSTTSKNNIANIYVKLIEVTDEMIANDPYIENKKPCVVCEPTDEGAMTLTEYAISKNWSIA